MKLWLLESWNQLDTRLSMKYIQTKRDECFKERDLVVAWKGLMKILELISSDWDTEFYASIINAHILYSPDTK
jgi:hypothetical protein